MQKKVLWRSGLIVMIIVMALVFFLVQQPENTQGIVGEEGSEILPQSYGERHINDVQLSPVGNIVHAQEQNESGYIVASEAGLAHEDCTSQEIYDLDEEICFFICQTETECSQKEAAIDLELASWEGDYEGLDDYVAHHELHDDDQDIRASYHVMRGEQIILEDGYDEKIYRDLWTSFTRVADDQISDDFIGSFALYEAHASDTVAYVAPLKQKSPQWGVYLNLPVLQSISERERTMTFVHEFSHILTLREGQVMHQADALQCATFFTGEGCAGESSYIHAFVEAFWSVEDVSTVDLVIENDVESHLYKDRPEDFVSAYAATNPGEDIAESFAHFVLKGADNTPETVAQQKIQFFARYPELVAMRQDMRAAIVPKRSYTRR